MKLCCGVEGVRWTLIQGVFQITLVVWVINFVFQFFDLHWYVKLYVLQVPKNNHFFLTVTRY